MFPVQMRNPEIKEKDVDGLKKMIFILFFIIYLFIYLQLRNKI